MNYSAVFLCGLASATPASAEVIFRMPATAGPEAFEEKAQKYQIKNPVEYWKIGSTDQLVVEKNYPPEAHLLQVVEFPAQNTSILKAILSKDYDDQFLDLAQRIQAARRPVSLRICHEFNGDWHACAAYFSIRNKEGVRIDDPANNDPRDFIPAYQHMVELIDAVASDYVSFDLNFNRESAREQGTDDFVQLYPGDRYVDVVSISSFNRCGSRLDRKTDFSFAEEFSPAYEAVTGFSQLPVAVAETGTTSLCGTDKVSWHAELLQSLKEDFPKVQDVTYFFEIVERDAASNDVELNWELNDVEAVQFVQLKNQFEEPLSAIQSVQRPKARPIELESEKKLNMTRPKAAPERKGQ